MYVFGDGEKNFGYYDHCGYYDHYGNEDYDNDHGRNLGGSKQLERFLLRACRANAVLTFLGHKIP